MITASDTINSAKRCVGALIMFVLEVMRLIHYNGSMISHSNVRAAIRWRDGAVQRPFRSVGFVYPIRFVCIQIHD